MRVHMSLRPEWFDDAVTDGLQLLNVLSLPGAPRPDAIAATALAWQMLVWEAQPGWDEPRDRERIRRGFVKLARDVERWPAPAALVRSMPSRPPLQQLPMPRQTPEERERAREFIERMRETCRAIRERSSR